MFDLEGSSPEPGKGLSVRSQCYTTQPLEREDYMSSEDPQIWEKGAFTIDHIHTVKGYLLPGGPVGFLKPSFEKDELISFLKAAYQDMRIDYSRDLDMLYIPKPVQESWSDMDHEEIRGFDAETVDGPKHLYTLDGWNWPWEIVIDDAALCECGHPRGDHVWSVDKCKRCCCRSFQEQKDN